MTAPLQRRSGIALWRQVADQIRQTLLPPLSSGDRLPPEIDLAARFGVNRHTVRVALAALEREGIVHAEQGRGTFVSNRRRLRYPIGLRTRFSEGLEDQARVLGATLLSTEREPAGAEVARAIGLEAGRPVIRLDTLARADGVPVSLARSWFDATRFPAIADHFANTGSVTRALALSGLADYTRASTLISAMHADAEDLGLLGLSPGAIVLETRSINVDGDGRPVQYARTRFAADRMEFLVGEA